MLLYMGGTFGCYGEPLKPMPAEQFLQQLHQLNELQVYDFDSQAAPHILDSSALNAAHWFDVIEQIHDLEQQGYRNFILIHGTDTLSYASAVLSRFLAPHLRLMITGSQLPLFDITGQQLRRHTDALDNLSFAFECLKQVDFGVYVCFAQHLLYGASVLKQHTHAWDAFNGKIYQTTDTSKAKISAVTINSEMKAKAENFKFLCITLSPQPIATLIETLNHFKQAAPHVLVLNAFGSGNFAANAELITCIQTISTQCLCVLSTQVPFGQLSQDYAVSDWVRESGLVRNNAQSHADLYAKCLELYLQYDSPAEWYQHWSIED